MNTAIADINSLPARWQQFDSSAPDPEEAQQAAANDYVDEWMRGNLYDDGTTYSGPLQKLIDNEPDLVSDMLADYRTGDVDELNASAGRVCRAIEQYVKNQAA